MRSMISRRRSPTHCATNAPVSVECMKHRSLIWITVGVAALIAGVGITWAVVSRAPSPEDAAEAYLAALASGEYARVEPLLAEPDAVGPAVAAAFEAAESYIAEDYSLETLEESAGGVGVRAEVTLGGEPGIVLFLLRRLGDEWRVDSADFLGTMTVTTDIGDSVRVGGELVVADSDQRAHAFLPAVYDVTAAPADLLSGSAQVTLDMETTVAVHVDAELTEQATVAAQEALDEYAATCAAPASTIAENCGFRVPWATDLAALESVAYRIEQNPSLSLDPDAGTFAATGGLVIATVTGTPREGGAASLTYRVENWTFRGLFDFVGDEMVLDLG